MTLPVGAMIQGYRCRALAGAVVGTRLCAGCASVAVGALRGAADGLSNAFQAGTSSGQSAWIGAAAGAGLGLVVGMAASAAKALKVQLAPHSAYEPCMGDGATAPARDAAVLADYEPGKEMRR